MVVDANRRPRGAAAGWTRWTGPVGGSACAVRLFAVSVYAVSLSVFASVEALQYWN